MEQKLKPIVITSGRKIPEKHRQNTTQQMILLKAMQITQDPKKLREMIGVKTVADVYRTLDKLQMRKEYHTALAEAGISFEFIISGIKDIAVAGHKDKDRLAAYQTLLKSIGLDKYDLGESAGSGTWEEELLKTLNKQKDPAALPEATVDLEQDYEVKKPVIPEDVRRKQEEEQEMTGNIYD